MAENGQYAPIDTMLQALRSYVPKPGDTGVQRISWAFGQVALSKENLTPEDERRLREDAERAVCAKYEQEIERLREANRRLIERYEPYACKHCGLSTANPNRECAPCAIL